MSCSVQIGYGNYVMQSNCSSVQPVYQQTTNPLLSPVPLVARHYGADYHLTAWAASGLTDSLQGSPDLPDFWKRGDATNASSSWNFTSWQPQVMNYSVLIFERNIQEHWMEPAALAPFRSRSSNR